MKRATAMYGSWLYCSKNIPTSACAFAHGSGRRTCAIGQPVQDRVGFDQDAAVVEFEQRHLVAVRFFARYRACAFPRALSVFDPRVFATELPSSSFTLWQLPEGEKP